MEGLNIVNWIANGLKENLAQLLEINIRYKPHVILSNETKQERQN